MKVTDNIQIPPKRIREVTYDPKDSGVISKSPTPSKYYELLKYNDELVKSFRK